jgi:hypothetical protein
MIVLYAPIARTSRKEQVSFVRRLKIGFPTGAGGAIVKTRPIAVRNALV